MTVVSGQSSSVEEEGAPGLLVGTGEVVGSEVDEEETDELLKGMLVVDVVLEDEVVLVVRHSAKV